MALQKELAEIGEVRITHVLDEANQLLREGWFFTSPPYCGLRKVNFNKDGDVYQPVDIQWSIFILAKKRKNEV